MTSFTSKDALADAVVGQLVSTLLYYAPLLVALLLLQVAARRWVRRRRAGRPGQRRSASASLPQQQIDVISRVGFERKPLLNREEFPVLIILEQAVAQLGGGLRVMAQTSLGEIIRPVGGLGRREHDLAFGSINSKRLDFAVFDAEGWAVLAVEYQGSGHYHGSSFIRDAVKKEALRKAGVPLLEVGVRYDPDELREQVRRILLPGGAGPRREPTLSVSDAGQGWQAVPAAGPAPPPLAAPRR